MVSLLLQVDELQAAARKRRRASGEVMQLAVKGEGGSMVPSTPEGVHEAKQWLDKWLQELEVMSTNCQSNLFAGCLFLGNRT